MSDCAKPQLTTLFTKDGKFRCYCHSCKRMVPASHSKPKDDDGLADPWHDERGCDAFVLMNHAFFLKRYKGYVKFTSVEK